MNECNSIETTDKTIWLTKQFRLVEISKIENYFIEDINQRKSCSKKLSKYVAVFVYIDQAFIVLSAKSGGVSIISFTSTSAGLTLFCSLTTWIVKNVLNITRKKKKKHDKFLWWLKVNSITLKL